MCGLYKKNFFEEKQCQSNASFALFLTFSLTLKSQLKLRELLN